MKRLCLILSFILLFCCSAFADGNGDEKMGSSRKVRETNRKEPDERKEEEVVTVPIS